MPTMIVEWLAAGAAMAMAFTIGFAIRRGSICMVDASYQWVVRRKSLRLRAFAIAAATSACVILPLAWVMPERDILSPTFPITAWLLFSAVMFGMGARLNGGCAFGTLSRLSGGDLNYSGSIVGAIAAGLVITTSRSNAHSAPALFDKPDLIGCAALLIFIILAIPALKRRHLQNLRSITRSKSALLRPFTAMLVIGVLGGLLFALAGSWTHLAVIEREGAFLAGQASTGADHKAIGGAAALVVGAVFAALHSGRFRIEFPSIGGWLRRLFGGAIMGAAAAAIPGGNGALLVYGIPSGSLSAWSAFFVMLLVLCVSFFPMRARS